MRGTRGNASKGNLERELREAGGCQTQCPRRTQQGGWGNPPAKVLGIPGSGAFQRSCCDQMLAGGAHGKCGCVIPVVTGVAGLQPELLVVYTHCSQRLKVHVHGCYKDRGFLN